MHDSVNYRDPLDILRRFTPTPHRAKYRIGTLQVVVESNDFTLLPSLPFEDGSEEAPEKVFDWKLVRDNEAVGPIEEPVYLTSEHLRVAYLGAACLMAVDPERRELVGFVGASVDASTFQGFLMPILCQMSQEANGAQWMASMPQTEEGRVDA